VAVASVMARQKARTRQRKTSRGDIAPSLIVTLAFAIRSKVTPLSCRTSSDRHARPHADEPQCRQGISNVRMSKPDGPRAIRASIVIFLQFGHGGLQNALMMQSRHQVGAQYSQSPVDAIQGGDGASLHPIGAHLLINIDHSGKANVGLLESCEVRKSSSPSDA
jgi:hypothetical protein